MHYENHQQDPNNRLGRAMIWFSMLAAMALLTWFFSEVVDRRNNPNRNVSGMVFEDGAVEVSLQQNPDGHYVASGSINGRDVVFLVDTGATSVALPGDLAKSMNLKNLGPISMNTANGISRGYLTRLDELRLGPIVVRDVRAVVAPNMDIEVLLGMEVLRDLDWRQRGDQLILYQPNSG